MNRKTKKNVLYIVLMIALLAVTLFVVWKSNDEIDYKEAANFFLNCNYYWLIPAFLCMFGFVLFEGLAIRAILRSLGYRPSFAASVAYSASDIYYSAITPSASGGQPASAAYMIRDGISPGETSFTLVFNLIAYTSSIVVIGLAVLFTNLKAFVSYDGFVIALVVFGFVMQIALFSFFIACLRWKNGVLKIGNGIIGLLAKLRISKHPEKLREKLAEQVEKYYEGGGQIARHKWLFAEVFLLNFLQRVCHILIPCFVMEAAGAQGVNFRTLFCMQTFVLVGYNCVPLPGGVGAFEFLYLNIYGMVYDGAFILVAMMIARMISYYICFILSGIYTAGYHFLGGKKKKTDENPEERVEK